MDSFFEFFAWVLFYYFVFKVSFGLAKAWSQQKEQEISAIKSYLDSIIHRVDVEVVNGVTYWFDKDNNAFLGQGKTVDDIISVVKQRFPTHVFLLPTSEVVTAKTEWKLVKYNGFHEIKYTIQEK